MHARCLRVQRHASHKNGKVVIHRKDQGPFYCRPEEAESKYQRQINYHDTVLDNDAFNQLVLDYDYKKQSRLDLQFVVVQHKSGAVTWMHQGLKPE